jgi:YD repeat-containing protein
LRNRQTQSTAPDGNRSITDKQYDGRGLTAKTSEFYKASPPSTALASFTDASVDQQGRMVYDGVGRKTSDEVWSRDVLQWKTTTSYGGDRVTTTPPNGAMPSQDVSDAKGAVIERRQFLTTNVNGAFDKTTYAYDRTGQLTGVTDAAGNSWSHTYDLLGRRTRTVDPDAGTSTSTYDNAGQVTSTTDGRSITLAYAYDALGRKTEAHDGTITGQLRASWSYDSVAKGQPTSSSRYDSGKTYTSTVGSYDDGYGPSPRPIRCPASEPGEPISPMSQAAPIR